MHRKITDAIVKAVRAEYADCRIYTEQVRQGYKSPCFSVRCINPVYTDGRGRQTRTYQYLIQYYPADDMEPEAECMDVSDILADIIASVDVDNLLVHSSGGNAQIVDGVLQYTISYSIHVAVKKNEEKIDSLGMNMSVRKE